MDVEMGIFDQFAKDMGALRIDVTVDFGSYLPYKAEIRSYPTHADGSADFEQAPTGYGVATANGLEVALGMARGGFSAGRKPPEVTDAA